LPPPNRYTCFPDCPAAFADLFFLALFLDMMDGLGNLVIG